MKHFDIETFIGGKIQLKDFQMRFITDKVKLRLFQILNELETNEVCSTARLTKATQSTARTIVTDINYLREYLKDVAEIISSKQGYTIKIISPTELTEKKRTLLESEPLFVILEKIFFNELRSVYDWADYFHISESTMIKYLKKITTEVKEFNVTLDLNPVNLIGSETDIRHFYFVFYYESDITPYTIFPSIAAQEAVIKISNLIETSGNEISSFGYFSYLLYLSIERICYGCFVKINSEIKSLVLNDPGFYHLIPTYVIIRELFDINLPEDEAIFMYLSILSRRGINNPKLEETFCKRYNKWPLIKMITHEFYEILDSNGLNRKDDLILIESFFTSAKLRSVLTLSGNKNIYDTNNYAQELFPDEYTLYRTFLNMNPNYKKVFSSNNLDDICASLTIFVESIKEQYWGVPMNIAFAIEGNEYIIQYIESWVKKYLGRFQNLFFLGPNDLYTQYFVKNRIDLFVTNYNEYLSVPRNLECILFKPIPDASDWTNLLNKINPKIIQSIKLTNS